MGSFYTKLFGKPKATILFQGLQGAGKTTMLYRMKLGNVINSTPITGVDVETVYYKNMCISVWDLGAPDRHKLKPLYEQHYRSLQAVVFVVDSNDRQNMDQARDELHILMEDPEMRDCVLLVMANKQDLPNASSPVEVSEHLKLTTLDHARIWNIFPTAAAGADSLHEAFDWLSTLQLKAEEKRNKASAYGRLWNRLTGVFSSQT